MRIFIAYNFNDEVKNYIKEIQHNLKTYCLGGNFTRIDNFHITLKFIGEVDKRKIDEIRSAVERTTESFGSFYINLGSLGYFPNKENKLIWIGLNNITKLKGMVEILNNNLSLYGYEKEMRRFNPHITLARQVKLNHDFSLVKKEIPIKTKQIPVNKISIMKSNRINGLLVYTPLYTADL